MHGQLKRAIHLDFHTMPGIYNFNESWDAAKFAERLDNAHVKYINAFAKCNLGFSYFDTKIGTPYPGMKGDMLGDLIDECHKRDIGVTAYFNLGIDHEMCRIHRDWCKVNREGNVLWGNRVSHGFRLPCYETDYGDYQYELIKELITKHPSVDGIFLDCINMSPCYGNECLEAIKAEGADPLNDTDVAGHTIESVMKFCRRVKKLIGDRKMICNSQPYWLMREFNTHIEVECLPSGGWGYDYFSQQIAYARNIKDTVLYMSGRFQASWGDFGGLKNKESLESDMWDAVMNAAECSIGDHMHPAEIIDETVYHTISEIYADIEAMEPWIDGAKYVANIGVLTHINSGFLTGMYSGISRILGELHYTYDIVNETMDFSKYKLLIIPDTLRLSPTLKERIAAHLSAGKPVLSTGLGGLEENGDKFALPEWDITVDGLDTSSSPYYAAFGEYAKEFGTFRHAAYKGGILMRANPGAVIYANYIKAYFNSVWDGFHGYMYMPPEAPTGQHMAVRTGNVCHIAFDLFTAYNQKAYVAHKKLAKRCICDLMDKPDFTCEGIPSTARVTLTETDENMLLHIKVTYPEHRGSPDIIEEHNVLPAGAAVHVRGNYMNALIVPLGENLAVSECEGITTLKLPEINGYICVALKKYSEK